MNRIVLCGLAVLALACSTPGRNQHRASAGTGAPFLYVWAGSADTTRRAAFLAVFDLRDSSPTAGQIVRIVPAGAGSRGTHHTEHQLASDGLLFANDFGTGRTYRFDLRQAGEPRLLGSFTTAGPLGFPHSYVRLPNGNRLITYQVQASKGPPGGLAEVSAEGVPLRWTSAKADGVNPEELQPYSLEVIPALDRAVSTSTSMNDDVGVHVQVWRLSDLALLNTIRVPPAGQHDHAGHDPEHHRFPGEPRVLADGLTIMLGTFSCGLYRLTRIDEADPLLEFVYGFPGANCAVPVVIGNYWVQTVPALHGLVVLDVSDPAKPREVSRISLGEEAEPHWVARDSSGRRLVVNNGSKRDPRLYLLRFDAATGTLAADSAFPTLSMQQVVLPGVGDLVGVPHGAVFAP